MPARVTIIKTAGATFRAALSPSLWKEMIGIKDSDSGEAALRAASPSILALDDDECFAFDFQPNDVYQLKYDDRSGRHYIVTVPTAANATRIYLYEEEKSWFARAKDELKQGIDRLNWAKQLDKLMKDATDSEQSDR